MNKELGLLIDRLESIESRIVVMAPVEPLRKSLHAVIAELRDIQRAMHTSQPDSAAPGGDVEQRARDILINANRGYLGCKRDNDMISDGMADDAVIRGDIALRAITAALSAPGDTGELMKLADRWEALAEKFYEQGSAISKAEAASMRNDARELREAIAALSAPSGDVEQRAHFERWVSKRWGCSTEKWADSGEYQYHMTRDWWQCWQAALSAPKRVDDSNADPYWRQAFSEISKIPLRDIDGDLFQAVKRRADELRNAASVPVEGEPSFARRWSKAIRELPMGRETPPPSQPAVELEALLRLAQEINVTSDDWIKRHAPGWAVMQDFASQMNALLDGAKAGRPGGSNG